MRLTPDLIHKYFEPLADDQWRILQDLRDSVRFSTANVWRPRRPGRTAAST